MNILVSYEIILWKLFLKGSKKKGKTFPTEKKGAKKKNKRKQCELKHSLKQIKENKKNKKTRKHMRNVGNVFCPS